MLMFSLSIWTIRNRPRKLLWDVGVLCSIGFLVELVGVRTAAIFGSYSYGIIMGPRLAGVPLLIGVTWFLVLAGSKAMATYLMGLARKTEWVSAAAWHGRFHEYVCLVLSAALAMGFDMVMEPAATRFGFWAWSGGVVPIYNYICWFTISFSIFTLFSRCFDPFSAVFLRRLWWILLLFFLALDFLG
jgi:bisanhydrobacterioruberin hydratase